MPYATHIIKIEGTFDKNIWKEKKELRCYVDDKIKNEIDPIWHPDLELFKVNENENKIDVWIYISTSTCGATKDIVERWIKNHIKEEGISVGNVEVEDISGREFFVVIN